MIDPNIVCPLSEPLDVDEVVALLEHRLERIRQASDRARLVEPFVLDGEKRELRLLVRLGRAMAAIRTQRHGLGSGSVTKLIALERRVVELTGP